MAYLTAWINHYGYIVLVLSFMLELIAIPIPGEVLMGYTGLLVFQGKLNWALSILAAWTGCCMGITIAYWIGYKLGTPFFHKYGPRIHMGPDKLEKTSKWFNKYGNRMLAIAYFIPGVRHITGYFSGITRIRFRTFALFAYLGAFLYTGTFISLGKVLGPQWEHFHNSIKKYLLIAGVIAAVVIAAIYLYKNHKEDIKLKLAEALNSGLHVFHSLRRVRFLILATAVVFLGLVVWMGGLIQDYFSRENEEFNAVVSALVPLIFNEKWTAWMKVFGALASGQVLLFIVILTFVWIIFIKRDRTIEGVFLLIVSVGGEIFEESLRRGLYLLQPNSSLYGGTGVNQFPNEQTLMALVVYGFFAFVLARHSGKAWVSALVSLTALIVLFLIGLSGIYFRIHSPSHTVAGYIFGGVWLSLNILLLEIFRLLRRID
jgi:membrane protein DedA with SNARE-associated domain